MIDLLSYTYGDALRPDRLTQMADGGKGFKRTTGLTGDHYLYDASGNMTQDKHKNLTLSYNFLNLPQSFTLPGGTITMTYTADGEKLTKTAGATTKNYVSGIEYSGANLEAIYFSEGRCTPNGATAFFYDYTIKDHLGNARVNFRASGATIAILEPALHYYPFGMLIEGLGTTSPTNDYAYNSKELNEEFGLNLYDYGARWYDPAVGRWWNVDPMGEIASTFSPYQYVENNPMILIDPDGLAPETVVPTGATEEQRQQSLQMIQNTLSADDAKFVRLDANGQIDKDFINSQESESGNFSSLKTLVNSEMIVEVSLAESFSYVDQNGSPGSEEMPYSTADEYSDKDIEGTTMSGNSTGESGFLGKTLFPDGKGGQNSPDGTIKVVINSKLSTLARAEVYSHEANGHTYIYVNSGGDRGKASHQAVGMKETNTDLKQRIITSKQETIKNMKQK